MRIKFIRYFRWMNRKAIAQIAFEFLSIVFAVLLALGLNSVKQNIDAKTEADKIKKAIVNECRLNLSRVDSTTAKNKDYAEYLDSLIQLDNEDIGGFYFAYDFELLTSSAWKLSQNNLVTNNLPDTFLMEAAVIYQTQSFYQNFSEKTFQSIGALIAQQEGLEPADMALSMYYNVAVINNVAEGLRQDQKEFLNKYDPPETSQE